MTVSFLFLVLDGTVYQKHGLQQVYHGCKATAGYSFH